MAFDPSHSTSSTSPILPFRDPHDAAVQHYYNYPPVHRPPPIHVSHSKRPSEAQRSETIRVHSSISSAESGSTARTGGQYWPSSPQSYRHGPNIERGFMTNEKAQSPRSPRSPRSPQRESVLKASSPIRQEMVEDNSAVIRYIQEQQAIEEAAEKEDDHAVWILFWLSCLDPIHSLINTIYTILVVFTLLLATPIRLCHSNSSFGDGLIRALAPLFRHHLETLYAPSVEDAYAFEFRPAVLVVVNISSPFLSVGVMLAAWVAAAFWLFALVMGNPDGTEKGDDGRDAVLSVRNWWESYLLRAIK